MSNIYNCTLKLEKYPTLAAHFDGVTELYVEFGVLWERYPAEPDVGLPHPYCDAADVEINYVLAIKVDGNGEIISEDKIEIRSIPEDVWKELKFVVYDSYIPQEALDNAMEDWLDATSGPDNYEYDDGRDYYGREL